MASIKPRKNKDGIITSYTISVLRGRDQNGKQIFSRRSYPDKKRGESIPTGWSQKRIEKEVERVAVLFEEECKKGEVATRKVTFDTYAREYLDNRSALKKLKNSVLVTYQGYLLKINDKELNGIGHLELDKITTQHINKFCLALFTKTSTTLPKPLSAKTIKNYKCFISSVLTYACINNIIKNNPCQYVTLPDDEENKNKEVPIIKKEDMSNVLLVIESLTPNWHKLFCYLAFSTGARLGEILGLRYCDCNFENNAILICNNIQYRKDFATGKKLLYNETIKNRQQRVVALPEQIMNMIKEHAKQKGVINLTSEFYLFAREDDFCKSVTPDAVEKFFARVKRSAVADEDIDARFYNHHTHAYEKLVLKKGDVVLCRKVYDKKTEKVEIVIGDYHYRNYVEVNADSLSFIPSEISPHKFRHTFASMMSYKQIDMVTISKMLGHTQVSTTSNIYSHQFEKIDKRAASVIDEALEKNA